MGHQIGTKCYTTHENAIGLGTMATPSGLSVNKHRSNVPKFGLCKLPVTCRALRVGCTVGGFHRGRRAHAAGAQKRVPEVSPGPDLLERTMNRVVVGPGCRGLRRRGLPRKEKPWCALAIQSYRWCHAGVMLARAALLDKLRGLLS